MFSWRVRPWERWTLSAFALLALVGLAVAVLCWIEAHADPVVVRYRLTAEGLSAPVSIAFLSDTHVNRSWHASSVDPDRLRRVVAQAYALAPDLVLLGGDYVSVSHDANDMPFEAAVAPFRGLRTRFGVFAVVGNHDCAEIANSDACMTSAFAAAGVRLLINQAVRAGPVEVAGVDDLWCGRPDVGVAGRAVAASDGRPVVLVSHNPDVFPSVPSSVALTLAGHTHGAQIVPPLIGPIVSVSRYGQRFRYGLIVERGRRLIVSCGLGGFPFRWNAHPEIVLVTLVPARDQAGTGSARMRTVRSNGCGANATPGRSGQSIRCQNVPVRSSICG